MSVESFLKAAEKRLASAKDTAEEDIEAAFVRYAKRRKCWAVKLIILNKRGFPDRTVLCPGGRMLFIEFKRKNKKPRPTQVAVRKRLEDLGFEYHVCDEKGQAEAMLDEFLAWG